MADHPYRDIAELRAIARSNNVDFPLGGRGFKKEKLYDHLLSLGLLGVKKRSPKKSKTVTISTLLDALRSNMRSLMQDVDEARNVDLDEEMQQSGAKDRDRKNLDDLILKVTVLEHRKKGKPKERYYGIFGDHTLALRRANDDILLPPNFKDSGVSIKPTFLKSTGWMYFDTPLNRVDLGLYQRALNIVNNKYHNFELVKEEAPLDKRYGIVGYDFPFRERSWLTNITGGGWDPALNPEFREDGTWLHTKCSIDTLTLNKALVKIKTSSKGKRGLVWGSLYPKLVHVNKKDIAGSFSPFIASKDTAALVGWGEHLRFMYKDDTKKMIYVWDPWMQDLGTNKYFKSIQNQVKKAQGYKLVFEARKPEQGAEGSCGVDSLARVIMVAEYGLKGARMEWSAEKPKYFAYPILANRIISIKR